MFEAIFDYCFPVDFKDRLRAKLSQAVQGNRRVRDFLRDIEKPASRFLDVNERAIMQALWNGMYQHIRLRLIEWGVSTERSSLKRIVRKAMDTEACEEIVQAGAPDYSVKPPGAQVGEVCEPDRRTSTMEAHGEG